MTNQCHGPSLRSTNQPWCPKFYQIYKGQEKLNALNSRHRLERLLLFFMGSNLSLEKALSTLALPGVNQFCVKFFERDRMLLFICLHLCLFKFSLQHHLSNLTVSFILCMTNTLIKIFKKISQLVWRYFGLAKERLLV